MEEQKMQLVEWLDDLCVRFIINLPQEELEQVERICFQIEEAQWFYEDFVRPLDPNLPSLPLRPFALQMFKHCPLFSQFDERQHIQAFDQWLAYKTSVPVRGAIMLNDDMDQVVLVKGWKKGSNWSFPRGKINKDETDLDCAVRETYEETGYDLRQAGLIPDDGNVKSIEVTMRSQHMKLFVFRGVPMDTHFETRTRKEISKIEWYKLSSLPGWKKKKQNSQNHDDGVLGVNKVYVVAPFLPQLKGWITQQRKHDKLAGNKGQKGVMNAATTEPEEYMTDERDAQEQARNTALYESAANAVTSQPADTPEQLNAAMHGNGDGGDLLRLLGQVQDGQHAAPLIHQQGPTDQAKRDGASLLALLQGRSPAQHASTYSGTHSRARSDFNEPKAASSTPQHHYDGWQRQPNEVDPMQSQLQPQAAPQALPSGRNVFAPPMSERLGSEAPENPVHTRHEQSDLDRTASLLRLFGRRSAPFEANAHQPSQPNHFEAEAAHPSFTQRPEPPPEERPVAPAPAASELAAPRLNAQAQSLLDVFKTARTARPSQASQPQPQPTAPSTVDTKPDDVRARPSLRTPTVNDSHSREAMLQSKHQQQMRREPQSARASSAVRSPVNAGHNAQQSALLDLFRKPSASASPITPQSDGQHKSVAEILQQPLPDFEEGQRHTPGPAISTATNPRKSVDDHTKPEMPPMDMETEPQVARRASPPKTPKWSSLFAPPAAELAASPSPTPQKKQIFDHKEGKMKDHIPSPRVLARPSSSGRDSHKADGSLTSATVTGPLREPDFGSIKRKNKHPVKKPEQPGAPRHGTVKILKRPETPKEASPPKPVATPQPAPALMSTPSRKTISRKPTPSPRAPRSPSGTRGKAEPSKPFTPQILRRPKPSEPEVEPSKDTSERLQSVLSQGSPEAKTASPPTVASPSDQTDRMLSIFQKPAAPASEATQMPMQTPAPPSAAHEPLPESHITSPAEVPMLEPNMPAPALSPDQKQALLPLFEKPSAPASTAPSPAHTGLGLSQKNATTQRATTPLTRSRFNSLASRDIGSPLASPSTSGILRSESNAGNASRRGSGTPISPNDKSFLLSYLTSFTKGTR